MTSNYEKFLEKDYQKLMDKYDIKSEKYKQLKYEYQLLQSKYRTKEGPSCGVNLTQTGEICKDETSYRFVPIKRRNHFIQYKCDCCGKEVHQNIPICLKEENQYSSEV